MTRAFGACLLAVLLIAATPPTPVATVPADLDLGPIPGPERLPEPEPFWTPLTIALVCAAGLAGLVGVWYFVRPRKPPPPVPPHEWALGEIDRLHAASRAGTFGPRESATAAADVLRRYLLLRFHIPAPEQTTAEVMRAIVAHEEIKPPHQDAIRGFFERTDIIKFTWVETELEEAASLLALARSIVSATAPSPPPEPLPGEPAERS